MLAERRGLSIAGMGDRDWPLPDSPHVPGRNARPEPDGVLRRIVAATPSDTVPDDWRTNVGWMAGLRLYASGFHWEAHEVWEAVWNGARPNSRERALVQGVIQLANAALKQVMGRPAASRRLAALARTHVAEAGPTPLMGLDPLALLDAIDAYRKALDADPDAAAPRIATACDAGTR